MNILIRLPNWVGDVVMSLPFIAAVKEKYPDCRIDVIAKAGTEKLLDLSVGVSRIFLFSKKKNPGLWRGYQFALSIKQKQKYDLFFCLPTSFSSAWIGFFTSAKKRIGYQKEWRSWMLTNSYKKPLRLHRSEEYLQLLFSFAPPVVAPSLDTRSHPKKTPIDNSLFPTENKSLMLNIYSEASSRTMPLHLAKRLIELFYYQYKYNIILCGLAKDKAASEVLKKSLSSSIPLYDYTGKTTMQKLYHLISRVDCLVSIDSGVAHIANAIGIPTLVLFGAGDELNTAPFRKEKLAVVRKPHMLCAPCLSNKCKYGTPICLGEIHPNTILDAFSNLIKSCA